jgi:hypothetical protein
MYIIHQIKKYCVVGRGFYQARQKPNAMLLNKVYIGSNACRTDYADPDDYDFIYTTPFGCYNHTTTLSGESGYSYNVHDEIIDWKKWYTNLFSSYILLQYGRIVPITEC